MDEDELRRCFEQCVPSGAQEERTLREMEAGRKSRKTAPLRPVFCGG